MASGQLSTVSQGRLVILALAGVVVTFAAVAVGLVFTGGPLAHDVPFRLLMIVLAALALSLFLLWPLLRGLLDRRARERAAAGADGAELERLFLSRAIVGAAFSESVALFALGVYLLSGQPLPLLVAALALGALLTLLPSDEKLSRYLATARGELGPSPS